MSNAVATRPNSEIAGEDPVLLLAHNLRAQLASVSGGLATDDYLHAWWEWWLNLAAPPTAGNSR